jgi:four helix bundle protein
MKENRLVDLSLEFAIDIVHLYEHLCEDRKEFVMSKQVLRSGTSVGANIHEANYAVSKADFIAKMQISLKEASESEYWLTILAKTKYLTNEEEQLQEKAKELQRILISTLNTMKQNSHA